MSKPLITAEELAAALGAPDLVVLDADWYLPAAGKDGRTEYEREHIPGAVFFDIEAMSDRSTPLPHMLPPPADFARAAGALGLRRTDAVVVYDHQGLFSAPRVWWTLRVMGFPHVRVLDGGLRTWLAEGRPVEAGAVPRRPAAPLAPAYDATLFRKLVDVRRTLEAGDAQVIDARSAGRFRGEEPEIRPGLPSGHMPGALNLPWGQVVGPDGRLRSPADLRAAFAAAGADPARPTVTTCGSGVSAAILALALAVLGHGDAPVYDGSWTEWASTPGMPVATGG